MMKNQNRVILILLLLTSFSQVTLNAQQSTIHWMQGIPQSIYTNPGLQPDARTYIGMPALSSISTGVSHTGFKFNDLVRQDNGSFYIDDDNMLSKLRKNNYFGWNYQHEILAFGFRVGDNYFSLNLTEKFDTRVGYPKDLMTLLLKGNTYFMDKDLAANFDGTGINANHYRELGFGYSKEFIHGVRAGARAKVLFGMGNINFEKTDISLYTDPETYAWNIQTNVLVNSSLPFIKFDLNEEDNEIIIDDDHELSPGDYIGNTENMGFAVDLGGVYEIDHRFTVGFSVLDLGFISWNSDLSNLSLKAESFDFDGVELDDLMDEDVDFGENLADTINELFEVEQTHNSYRTSLPAKLLLSGTYNISDIHKAGLLARGEIYDGSFYPSFTASYSIQPIPAIGASLSYSVIHGNFSNVGAGLHMNIWPLQIYLSTDNFIPAMRPHTMQTATLQFGINWVIGYRPDVGEKPMYSW